MDKQAKIVLSIVAGLVLIIVSLVLWNMSRRKDQYLKPINGPITSGFGYRNNPLTGKYELHNGTDFSAPIGTEIKAPKDGIVEKVYYNSSGGNQIIIAHPDGNKTGYAHLDTTNVEVNQIVKQGFIIGTVGKTGQVTGPHLHFTFIDPFGSFINPETVLV